MGRITCCRECTSSTRIQSQGEGQAATLPGIGIRGSPRPSLRLTTLPPGRAVGQQRRIRIENQNQAHVTGSTYVDAFWKRGCPTFRTASGSGST